MPRLEIDHRLARILVVDDDPLSLFLVTSLLGKAGYRSIEAANDGRSALKLCRARQTDVVILDMVLPDVSGLEVLTILRDENLLDALSVIVVTASEDPEVRWAALELGAFDYVPKPIDRRQLEMTVGNVARTRMLFAECASRTQELEERIRQRTARLEQALELLKQAEKRIVEVTTKVTEHHESMARRTDHISRELRSPLKAILGYAQVLTGAAFGPLGSERYQRYAHDIEAMTSATIDLVNESLDPHDASLVAIPVKKEEAVA